MSEKTSGGLSEKTSGVSCSRRLSGGNAAIDEERLWSRLQSIASIGEEEPGKGVSRFSWSAEYRESAVLLQKWMKAAGMETRVDAVGNVFGRLAASGSEAAGSGAEGEAAARLSSGGKDKEPRAGVAPKLQKKSDSDTASILVGSHLDTVPHGGRFDGIAGIMAGLEAITAIAESGLPRKHPLELAAFINEEATQFLGGLFGSKALCGDIDAGYIERAFEKDSGQPLKTAMAEYGMGLEPEHPERAAVPPGAYHRFLEVHIEQGNELESKGLPVAAVSVIAGIQQFYITINGEAAHAGGLSMAARRDAMAAAVCIAAEVERLAKTSGSSTRGTVGSIRSEPGEHNIIAGKAVVAVDIREEDEKIRSEIYHQLLKFTDEQCRVRRLSWEIEMTADVPPVVCDPQLRRLIQKAAEQKNILCGELVSYAAHDAMVMHRLCPTGMIFFRCRGGLSHCPEERADRRDLAAATDILLEVLRSYTCGSLIK